MVRGFFFLLNAMCVFLQIPPSLKGRPKKVEKFNAGSERKKEEKVQFLLSQGSFITINCVMTPADIQIDLPSPGDHLACAEVSHTKDSFVSLMKGFLPQRFFKPKSTYFILHFDCCNGLIYEVTVETRISLVVLQPQNGLGINLKSPDPMLIFQKMQQCPQNQCRS